MKPNRPKLPFLPLLCGGLFLLLPLVALPQTGKRLNLSPSLAKTPAMLSSFRQKSRASSLPPVFRPTSPTPNPLASRQVERHRERVGALKQNSAGVFAPTGEKMSSKQELDAKDREEKARGLAFAKIVRGNTKFKEIALTFDDGPHASFTPRLLDLLDQLNLHVTFFLVGEKVDESPYLVLQMVQAGHEVANHTYHHVNLKKLPLELVETEIHLGNDAIRRACGIPPLFFRPPGGQYDDETIRAAMKLNMTTVLWTDDPADYAKPGEQVIEKRLLNRVSSGAVILLHDGIEQTLDILPDLVSRLRHAGYRFVTMSELAQHLESRATGQR